MLCNDLISPEQERFSSKEQERFSSKVGRLEGDGSQLHWD
jgi:hypothetical protein